MFNRRSIRQRFFIQLFLASFSLIFVFTSFTYFYIQNSMYNEKKEELLKIAQNIAAQQALDAIQNSGSIPTVSVSLVHLKHQIEDFDMYESTRNNQTYLTILYPFKLEGLSYLKITKNITPMADLLKSILHSIFFINIFGLLLILIYAIMLSKMLLMPIKILTNKLSNMNEHLMQPINIEKIPQEFEALGETINHLINRVQTFLKYQKELFIGTAHELKTPLAVIKLKNQVTMIKKRSAEEYIEALEITNKTTDEMNIIVSNILNIGRQEGAQLEKPTEVDIIALLWTKASDFKLLAQNENKELLINLQPKNYTMTLQTTLINQIVQNFLQNALKFTPPDKKVEIRSFLDTAGLTVEVIDEGCGIDTSADLFAPFKRQGNKKGVGLGLFLAKSAADAMGASLTLTNREDGISGTIARLVLPLKLSCPLH
jgi:two-component system, OmpR family, sensor kinase